MTAYAAWVEAFALKLRRLHRRWVMKLQFTDGQLRSTADQLFTLISKHPEMQDPLDYALGALHGLALARVFEYDDRDYPLPPIYLDETLLPRVQGFRGGVVRVDGKWAAGFYFNSALARLDAVHERLEKPKASQGPKPKSRPKLEDPPAWCAVPCRHARLCKIHTEVGKLKHVVEGTAPKREVTFEDAVGAFKELFSILDKE